MRSLSIFGSGACCAWTWHLGSNQFHHRARKGMRSQAMLAGHSGASPGTRLQNSFWKPGGAGPYALKVAKSGFSRLPISSVVKLVYKPHEYIPICSMYGISTNICPKNHPNVVKYTIHGASGI